MLVLLLPHFLSSPHSSFSTEPLGRSLCRPAGLLPPLAPSATTRPAAALLELLSRAALCSARPVAASSYLRHDKGAEPGAAIGDSASSSARGRRSGMEGRSSGSKAVASVGRAATPESARRWERRVARALEVPWRRGSRHATLTTARIVMAAAVASRSGGLRRLKIWLPRGRPLLRAPTPRPPPPAPPPAPPPGVASSSRSPHGAALSSSCSSWIRRSPSPLPPHNKPGGRCKGRSAPPPWRRFLLKVSPWRRPLLQLLVVDPDKKPGGRSCEGKK